MASRSTRWVFTINNPEENDRTTLSSLEVDPKLRYLVVGSEKGPSGTPHLQGFVIWRSAITLSQCVGRLGGRAHVEQARGSNKQASEYCKKDGQFVEVGDLPKPQGRRTDWDGFKVWVLERGDVPTSREIILEFPGLYARYKRACMEYAQALIPVEPLTKSTPRLGWQTRAEGIIKSDPNDRKIYFFVDPNGNTGKSWFCKYALSVFPERTQVLRVGKRDDLAHVIDCDKDIFLFDIPRNQMEYLQYPILEMLKDRMVFSPKYESEMKVLRKLPHVIVFCNENPDMNSMSLDRYEVIEVSS